MPLPGEQIFVDGHTPMYFLNMKGKCRDCGVEFQWARNEKGRQVPIFETKDGWASHFSLCLFSPKPRKKERVQQKERLL
jgi:hypothetical protein